MDFATADIMGWQWHQLNHMQAICTCFAPEDYKCQHLTSQIFMGWMPFLTPNQQRQGTEGQALI